MVVTQCAQMLHDLSGLPLQDQVLHRCTCQVVQTAFVVFTRQLVGEQYLTKLVYQHHAVDLCLGQVGCKDVEIYFADRMVDVRMEDRLFSC